MANSQMFTAWDRDMSVIDMPDAGLTVAGLVVAGAGVAAGAALGVWAWA
jgi:hypothetical protein